MIARPTALAEPKHPADKPTLPVIAGALAATMLGDTNCPKCGSTLVQRPIQRTLRCGKCGAQWESGMKIGQRPVTRADLIGTRKYGTPFLY